MKKFLSRIIKHRKSLIVIVFTVAIAVVLYTDPFNIENSTPVADYIYNMNTHNDTIKILGEATLVDSNGINGYPNQSGYFVNAQLNKEKSRYEALETLQVVIDSSDSAPDIKDKALDEIMHIASDIEIEATVEEMIKAKGFDDCVAIISGENINVIVKSEGLLTSEVAQITDIVKNETGFEAKNIRIIEKV